MKAFIWHEEYDYFIYVGEDVKAGQDKYNEHLKEEYLREVKDADERLAKQLAYPQDHSYRTMIGQAKLTSDDDYREYHRNSVEYHKEAYEEALKEHKEPDHIIEEGEFRIIDHANE